MQAYSDPSRAFDPYALPDIEVFCITSENPTEWGPNLASGWYWQACFPGCLPDGEPNGPFPTPEEAIMDARRDQ